MLSEKLKMQAKELISELKDIAEFAGMEMDDLMEECSSKEMGESEEYEDSIEPEMPEAMGEVDENMGVLAPKGKKIAIIAEIKKKRMGA